MKACDKTPSYHNSCLCLDVKYQRLFSRRSWYAWFSALQVVQFLSPIQCTAILTASKSWRIWKKSSQTLRTVIPVNSQTFVFCSQSPQENEKVKNAERGDFQEKSPHLTNEETVANSCSTEQVVNQSTAMTTNRGCVICKDNECQIALQTPDCRLPSAKAGKDCSKSISFGRSRCWPASNFRIKIG